MSITYKDKYEHEGYTAFKTNSCIYTVKAGNGKHIATFYKDDAGYFLCYMLNGEKGGMTTVHTLKSLAALLDEINKEWDEMVKKTLAGGIK